MCWHWSSFGWRRKAAVLQTDSTKPTCVFLAQIWKKKQVTDGFLPLIVKKEKDKKKKQKNKTKRNKKKTTVGLACVLLMWFYGFYGQHLENGTSTFFFLFLRLLGYGRLRVTSGSFAEKMTWPGCVWRVYVRCQEDGREVGRMLPICYIFWESKLFFRFVVSWLCGIVWVLGRCRSSPPQTGNVGPF